MAENLAGRFRSAARQFLSGLRSALFAGALVLAPLGITIWVFFTLVGVADGFIGVLPEFARPETYLGFPIPGLGILVTILLVAGVGYTMRYYTGRRVVLLYEAIFRRVPVLNGVYNGLKQLFETLFQQKGKHFRQVVLVEYPRRGVYCLAFLTNERPYVTTDANPVGESDQDLVSVFLPTTPNPTSGFYLLVPRCEVLLVEMGVEEAFKLIMSAGIVAPSDRRVARPMGPPCKRDEVRLADDSSDAAEGFSRAG